MQCDGTLHACDTMWFVVKSCYVILVVRSGELEDDVLQTTEGQRHSTTNPDLKSATKYDSVLQSITPYYKVLLHTTAYCKVSLRTTKYYSVLQSSTQYYQVLLHNKVLHTTGPQSTTPH